MTDREQRQLPLGETELRLASLRENEFDEVLLLLNDPAADVRGNSTAHAFWRWWILRSLINYWKTGRGNPSIGLTELHMAWDWDPHELEIVGGVPLSELWDRHRPRGFGNLYLGPRANRRFIRRLEKWVNENHPRCPGRIGQLFETPRRDPLGDLTVEHNVDSDHRQGNDRQRGEQQTVVGEIGGRKGE